MLMPKKARLALALSLALAASAPAFAQQTSAAVGGRVTESSGQPVVGAEVTILHAESGTVSYTTTDASGRYSARGLRVGGPYTITIEKDGQVDIQQNIYLQLGDAVSVNSELSSAQTLDTVEVLGIAGYDVFSPDKMGTGTYIDQQRINALPSANRNIQDYIRMDPRIAQVSKADGAISAGGQNTRYNLIRIDGVSTNDPFGLESNNLPTERQPVSLDAIEAINIDLANYDVTIAGGTGAVVNAVTKSGTNEFSGSVYGTFRDGDWVRRDLQGEEFNGWDKETTYGGTFGGPILKDTLFFFVNYEKYVRDAPGTSLASTPYGRGQITDADIAQIQQIASGYGMDIGSLALPDNSKTEIEEYAAKIDWNISDNHRAALRYSKLEQSVLRTPGIANSTVSLSSYWYNHDKVFESTTAELFSDWNDYFSTELKASYRKYDALRNTTSNLPEIRVAVGNQNLLFGTERNSHINVVQTDELSLFGAGNLYIGDHTVKLGFDYSKNDILNLYGRDLNGYWAFQSIADFAAGRPSNYQVRTPRPGGSIDDVAAEYEFENLGLFLQDTWMVNNNLTVSYGVRVDRPEFGSSPLANPRLQQLYGLDNTVTIDKSLVQPRFGFNYSFDTERRTQLRGGFGLFQGAGPNVWLAGAFQNTGMNFDAYNVSGNNAPNFNPSLPPSAPGGTANRQIVADIMDPDLAQPAIWKGNLALERELPWYGMVASAELLMLKNRYALYFDRLDVGTPTAIGPDGRLIFWNPQGLDPANATNTGIQQGQRGAGNRANRPSDVDQAIVIRNTKEGSSRQFTLSLDKPLTDNWGWTLAYTYTEATEFSPATSSQNSSNWSNTLVFQANEPENFNSRYAIKDRVTGILTYQNSFFGDNKTTISAFYEGRSGRPYSYIFYNDVNGDSATTNDLFYVPTGPGDVLFTGGAAMETAFFEWLAANPQLDQYRGRVVPANSHRSGWVNNFDIRLSQEIPSFFDGHKMELTLDIMNVGNLVNSDWGLIDDYGFFSTRRVANYSGIDPASGRYVYTFSGNTDNPGIQENNNDKGNTAVSRWSVMLGLRYRF